MMTQLNGLVVENVKEHLFSSDRLARIPEALVKREGAKDEAVQKRRSALEAKIEGHDDRLKRLYRAIERASSSSTMI